MEQANWNRRVCKIDVKTQQLNGGGRESIVQIEKKCFSIIYIVGDYTMLASSEIGVLCVCNKAASLRMGFAASKDRLIT